METINLDIFEKLVIALAYRHGLTMDDLNNKNIESVMDDKEVVVGIGYDAWRLNYGTGVDADFQKAIAKLLEEAKLCKGFLEQGDLAKCYIHLHYSIVAARDLENFFAGMRADLEKLRSYDQDRYMQYLKELGVLDSMRR